MLQSIFILLTILLPSISFNMSGADSSKIHCVTKEMSDNHKAEIRLRVHYDKIGKIVNPHAYATHDSTDPKDKSSEADYEDPGSGNTYCYPVEALIKNISDVEALHDFRIDVKHAGDCKNWDLYNQQLSVPAYINDEGRVTRDRLPVSDYTFENSTQTYALRYYHFGVHTHCKTRKRVYAN